MSDFELVTGPTFILDQHRLWLNRGWRDTARRVYRISRATMPVNRAKSVALGHVLPPHWHLRDGALT